MEEKEKREYLIHKREQLYKLGFRCMTRAAFVIVAMFILCVKPGGDVRYFPEPLFWGFQIFTTVVFAVGAVGYLISLTIRVESEDQK